jgi:hypothetical protein
MHTQRIKIFLNFYNVKRLDPELMPSKKEFKTKSHTLRLQGGF